MKKDKPPTVVKLLPTQWVDVKYGGKMYLVCVASILDAWMEKENGKESVTRNKIPGGLCN